MTFAVPDTGLDIDLRDWKEDLVTILFHENPGVILQVKNEKKVTDQLKEDGLDFIMLGEVTNKRKVNIQTKASKETLDIDSLRDTWFRTSFLLDSKQREQLYAEQRFQNYKNQELKYRFPSSFTGNFEPYQIDPLRRTTTGIRAAIIREKGVNGDREMAFALYLAGFDVKDVHMTDLVSGREDLSDINLIVFVGGFSNSDVLGSAKGWAGAFLYNPKAKQALENFYKRSDTLSLGVCNGCQLIMELGLIYPEWKDHPKMHHNASGRFESIFLNITIAKNNSVMLQSMAGSTLGVWVAHGEGRFILPEDTSQYTIAAQYTQQGYPGTPSGSTHSVAALCSKDGRHLGIMPHIERSLFPWNWPYYPADRKGDKISPWIETFVNAREWIATKVEK
jgi:phosphoribosylformylglycinamidine synthase